MFVDNDVFLDSAEHNNYCFYYGVCDKTDQELFFNINILNELHKPQNNHMEINTDFFNLFKPLGYYFAASINFLDSIEDHNNEKISYLPKIFWPKENVDEELSIFEYYLYNIADIFTNIDATKLFCNEFNKVFDLVEFARSFCVQGKDYKVLDLVKLLEKYNMPECYPDFTITFKETFEGILSIPRPLTAMNKNGVYPFSCNMPFNIYKIVNLSDLLFTSLHEIIKSKKHPKKCELCNRIFIYQNKSDEKYCRVPCRDFSGMTCRDKAAKIHSVIKDEVAKLYDLIYNRYHQRVYNNTSCTYKEREMYKTYFEKMKQMRYDLKDHPETADQFLALLKEMDSI